MSSGAQGIPAECAGSSQAVLLGSAAPPWPCWRGSSGSSCTPSCPRAAGKEGNEGGHTAGQAKGSRKRSLRFLLWASSTKADSFLHVPESSWTCVKQMALHKHGSVSAFLQKGRWNMPGNPLHPLPGEENDHRVC